MSPIAQRMTVSSTVRKQWLEDVATDVLDPAEKLVIRVFDQLGGRRLVRTTVTGTHTTAWKSLNALSVCSRGEPPPGAGDDDSSVDRLQRSVTQSMLTEHSQSVQSLCTATDDVLHVVSDGQTAGDCDSEYLQ